MTHDFDFNKIMNILFIYVPAAFTTEFQLQLVTRSCFSGAFLYQQFKQKY